MDLKPKILVVDDKKENLFAIETVLRDLDVELVKVTSGNDALKTTLHHKFVLALLDIQMPGMDGYELAGILREEEQTAKLPFIFISAVYTDPTYVFKGYELGAFSFITKPFQPEILINKVRFFVDKYRHEAELEQAYKDLNRKNKELSEAYKELDFFTVSVSNDLRAPLRHVQEYISIFKEEYDKKIDTEGKRLMDIIYESAENMSRQLGALLIFSHLGKKEINKSEINMEDLFRYALDEISKEYPLHKYKIIIEELPPGYGDPIMIKQVATNLLSNAVKYSAKVPEPVITVSGQLKNNETIYKVEDNGVGFNMKYANRLFKVFQRLHSVSEYSGTGVGLAFVKRIVNRHEGKVWADAEEGKGARFYFSLPVKKGGLKE